MRSLRTSLAWRMALSSLALFAAIGFVSVAALRSMLYRQLDSTLLHLSEVEAQAGAAEASSEFRFHEGILLAAREGPSAELTRYAQLWTSDGSPLVRTRNLTADLVLAPAALTAAREGRIGWSTDVWRGRRIRSVVYPLRLVGAAHQVHLLQVAAPTEPIATTVRRFAALVGSLLVLGAGGAYLLGGGIARQALRPTAEITAQAEAISAGTLSERITAHADVVEFSRLVLVLNSMLDRLDGAFRVQRQFTADASHELRAPLAVLKGEIDVALRRQRGPEEYHAALVRSREEVERLADLTGELLALARLDAAVPLEHLAEVEVGDIVDRAIVRFKPLAFKRGVEIAMEGTGGPVLADSGLLDRIVGNLLDNAVKHARPNGTVRLTLTAEPGQAVTLVVTDDGPGVDSEQAPQIFERFFQGDPARQRSSGVGLGLAIARAGAEAHGGRLEFVGNGPGAMFRLTLPAATPGGQALARHPGSTGEYDNTPTEVR